ncbi:MAG: site-specific integrase [Bacteroidales bacterium]
MSTNILILLDSRREKKDKTFPLILRIIHNRKSTSIPLGYNLKKNDWNEEKSMVKPSFKGVSSVTRLNNYIQKQKLYAFDIINKLQESGEIETLSVSDIKSRILLKSAKVSFYEFTNDLIDELKGAGRFGYAQSVYYTMNAVKRFMNEKDFDFDKLNYKFIVQFENHLKGRSLSLNSIAVYMKTIKMIYNRAVKVGVAKKESYPFDGYTIKTAKTRKRAVRRDVIELIENLDLPKNTKIWHSRNYFLFSFYAMGINFVDIADLKMSNIVEGRLEYTRNKTKKDYSIKITEPLQNILNLYIKNKKKEDYIFPIVKRIGNPELEFKDVVDQRLKYNRLLKKIAEMCGIETNLTSYVSRHSWATIAKHKGVPVAVISEGMGHSDTRITEVYLDSFDKEVLDNYNEMITG